MQAAAVKRRAVFQNPQLRMSANNVRDVMRYLLSTGIARRVEVRKKAHPRYELTDLGRTFQQLLVGTKTR
jgi:DNA-binding HxlR family transcriptional regulator